MAFTGARKIDLGDFIMRKLYERDRTLSEAQIRMVCSHLYNRLRTKKGKEDYEKMKVLVITKDIRNE